MLGSHQTWLLSSFDADKDQEYIDLRCCDRCCQARRIAQSTFLSQLPRLGGTEQKLLMTLGRFLFFFVVGLVLAIAFPPLNWLIWPLAALAAVVVVRLIRG